MGALNSKSMISPQAQMQQLTTYRRGTGGVTMLNWQTTDIPSTSGRNTPPVKPEKKSAKEAMKAAIVAASERHRDAEEDVSFFYALRRMEIVS